MAHEIQHPENDGMVSVWDTEAEALTAQDGCYSMHMPNHNDDPNYTAGTTSWATPRQRLDGKWVVKVCHHRDATEATNIEPMSEQEFSEEF